MLKNIITSYKDCPVEIDKQTYNTIAKDFMKFISNKILAGESVRLPSGMGMMQVIGKKVKPKLDDHGNITGLSPDWVKTGKLWEKDPEAKAQKKMIYHFNEHTNGVRYKIYWTKTGFNIINKVLYNFRAVRSLKRGVSENAMNGKEYRIIN